MDKKKQILFGNFMKDNKEALTDDVRYLQTQTFFEKYHERIERLLLDIHELKIVNDSEDFTKKILGSLVYETELYEFKF
jgi:hypothetical protein